MSAAPCGRRLLWVVFATTQLALGQMPASADPTPVPSLRIDEPVEAEHRADQAFAYQLTITDSAPLLVFLDQRGLDLTIELERPGGAIERYDSPLFRDDREVVLLEDPPAGDYRLTVSCQEFTDAIGGHSLRLTRIAKGAPALDAWRFMSRAGAAQAGERYAEAARDYADAARRWSELGDQRNFAHALYAEGMIEYWWLGSWRESAELAKQAYSAYAGVGETTLAANARQLQALALIELANEVEQSDTATGISPERQRYFDDALAIFADTAQVHQAQGNRFDLAQTTNYTGLAFYYMGDYSRAREHYLQAEAIYRELGELRGQLQTQNNIAVLDTDQGHHREAAATLERGLTLLPPGREPQLRADLLDNLGNTYRQIGDIEQALGAFSSALALHEGLQDRVGRGRSLYGLGQTYFSFGELDLARTYLDSALPVVREDNDGRIHRMVLLYLGDIAHLQGYYPEALKLHQEAFELATSPQDRAWHARAISRDLDALGQADEALRVAKESERAAQSSGSALLVAGTKLDLARALYAKHDWAQAASTLQAALAITRSLGLHAESAEILKQQALTAAAQGDLAQAADFGQRAISQLEELRGRLADPELRAFYLSTRRDFFDVQIDTIMRLYEKTGDPRYAAEALATSEQSRARMTVDLLNEAADGLLRNVPQALKQRQTDLSEQLAAVQARRDRMLRQGAGPRDSIQASVREMAGLENELHLLDAELRRRDPRGAGLGGARTLSTKEIQGFLDANTVLLQYTIADPRSYVWVVSRNDVKAVELAPRSTIEPRARKAFEDLRERNSKSQHMAQSDLAELSRLVVEPIAAALDRQTVLVVPDGALQYVPFGLLSTNPDGSGTDLMQTKDIIALPSMSALAAMQHDHTAPKTLAVFADPVFQRTDPRFATSSPSKPDMRRPTETLATRQAIDPADLTRLAMTGQEAEWVSESVPPGERFVATGFDASRDAVLNASLEDYRYVHFATHGLIDARYPTLSALALAQFDRDGRPVNGFLRLNDIFRLKLNADLVVLSACDTALGREIRGESLMGLTQGFFYAGARTLVVSLWQVPDRATATLMRAFYAALLNGGANVAEALRKAQLTVAAKGRWADPYFWGAFIVLGDWR